MRIAMSGRFLERNVGGNTTYARSVRAGVEALGHTTTLIPWSRSAVATALDETRYGMFPPRTVDVVHYLADTGPLLRVRKPCVVTVHGIASRWIDVARSRGADRIWRTRVARAIAVADAVITVSESSARDIVEEFGVNTDQIHVIPHGLDTDAIVPPTEVPKRLWHLQEERFVLYLGNIEPRKNLVELAAAFQDPMLADVRLVVAGRPAWDFEASLHAFAGTPSVEYLGFVSDEERAWLYRNCALFAFPSLYEGFGFPVLEALGAGVPVVCSTRGSLAEIAGPSWTIDDVTAPSISAAIRQALDDEHWRNRVVVEGPAWAARFSWDESVRRHIEVYESVARR